MQTDFSQANDRSWDENGYVISLDSGELEEGEEAVALDVPEQYRDPSVYVRPPLPLPPSFPYLHLHAIHFVLFWGLVKLDDADGMLPSFGSKLLLPSSVC